MAVLPTVGALGGRPVPQPQRQIARIDGADSVGREMERLGATVANIGDDIMERDATAAAKERDTYAADEIRKLLFDPENGFANSQGKTALERRQDTIARLEQIRNSAKEGLSPYAARKLDAALDRRIESAKDRIDTHSSTQRSVWVAGASAARRVSAQQDAIYDFSATDDAIAVIDSELRGELRRGAISQEEFDLKRREEVSEVYKAQIGRIASSDPVAAVEYLRENQDDMLPTDVAALESTLSGEVKRAAGRAAGRAAAMDGVSTSYLANIRRAESGGNDLAKNPLSSATGRYQFTAGTWAQVMRNHPELGLTADGRTDGNQQELAIRPLTADNAKVLRANGFSLTGGNLYAAHFLGAGGAVSVLSASDGTAVSNLVSGQVIAANPFLANMTVGDFRAWAHRKGGDEVAFSEGRDMESLLSIPDPIERDEAFREFDLIIDVETARQEAATRAASQAAFEHIERGGDINALPLDIRQGLGHEAMSSLRAYERSRQTKTPIETDPKAYLELRTLQRDDPAAFQKVDMIEYVDKLDSTDWQSMVDAQTKPVEPDAGFSTSTLMSMASSALENAGIESANQDVFQSEIVRWQDRFIEKMGRSPSQGEVQEHIDARTMEVFINLEGAGGRTRRVLSGNDKRLFQVEFDAGTPALEDDMTFDDLLRADKIAVGGMEVKERHLRKAYDSLVGELGREPTAEEVMNRIAEAMARL